MPRIEKYDFGEIVVDGKRYSHDIILFPDGRVQDWWREEGHYLKLADIFELLEEDIDALVIGTGYYGRMKVDDEVVDKFTERGVDVYYDVTGRAVKMYNELASRGRKVAGAFHLTC